MRNASGDGDLLHLDAPQVPGAPLRRYGHVDRPSSAAGLKGLR